MLKRRKNISGGKKHLRAGECQGAKKKYRENQAFHPFISTNGAFLSTY